MKLRKVVVLFLVASMVFSFMSCTRQTAAPQEEHTSEENDTVQENIMEEDNVEEDQLPEEISKKTDSLNESSAEKNSSKTKNFSGEPERETKEQSQPSQELPHFDESQTEGKDDELQLLSAKEIQKILSDLDTKEKELFALVQKDYRKIPITDVPTHIIENTVVDVKWVSADSKNPDAGGFQPVYGTAIFAKVTEKTLPYFPWESVEEINAAITQIYDSVSESFGLDCLTKSDLNDIEGVFYQFEDGLYFRADYTGDSVRSLNWDYSTMEILENKPDEVCVQMYEINSEVPVQRGIKKNETGKWVLMEPIFG